MHAAPLHFTIHTLPQGTWPRAAVELAGVWRQALALPPASLAAPLPVSFETAGERLGAFARCFFEPDGSFVWTEGQGASAWQIDGMLYDRNGALLYVEVKMRGSFSPLDDLLGAFGWPQAPLAFTLVRDAVVLDESEFRRHWAARPG